MPDRFVLRNGLRIHVRSWGGEYVLLDEVSGDTHLVGPEVIGALSRLNPSVASRVAIQGSPPAEAIEQGAREDEPILESLLRLGLIEPANR